MWKSLSQLRNGTAVESGGIASRPGRFTSGVTAPDSHWTEGCREGLCFEINVLSLEWRYIKYLKMQRTSQLKLISLRNRRPEFESLHQDFQNESGTCPDSQSTGAQVWVHGTVPPCPLYNLMLVCTNFVPTQLIIKRTGAPYTADNKLCAQYQTPM
jgi:hypothetical protein